MMFVDVQLASSQMHNTTHCTAGLFMHQVLMKIQGYLLPMQRAQYWSLHDQYARFSCESLGPRDLLRDVSSFPPTAARNINNKLYIQTTIYRHHAYLFSFPLMFCIPSECMLVVRNSVKLHRVGQYLNLEYTHNCFYESVQLVPLTNMPQSLTTSNIHLRQTWIHTPPQIMAVQPSQI